MCCTMFVPADTLTLPGVHNPTVVILYAAAMERRVLVIVSCPQCQEKRPEQSFAACCAMCV